MPPVLALKGCVFMSVVVGGQVNVALDLNVTCQVGIQPGSHSNSFLCKGGSCTCNFHEKDSDRVFTG